MKNLKLILFFFLVTLQSIAQPDLKKLDAYLAKALKDWDVPGMSVAIVKDGKVVFSKGYGVKEVGKPDNPDGNTLYAIASLSKGFTSTAIAMMAQEGKLSLDDKVRTYLPYFEVYDPYVSKITTIRDLLCHRIGYSTFSGDVIWYLSDDLTIEQMIKRMKYLPQGYGFRAGYGYSNMSFLTAGEIMTTIEGKSWSEIVQQRILNPLGMDRSVTSSRFINQKGNYATPHAFVNGIHNPISWEDWGTIAAMGGIISSVEDMSKWMIFNLNNGMWKNEMLLTPQSRTALWTPHNNFTVNQADKNFDMHFNGYALGWTISDYKGKLRIGHSGGYSGMLSVIDMVPDENLGVVVLTNGMRGGLMFALSNYIVDAYLKAKERDWSGEMLINSNNQLKEDTRIADRIKARVEGTKPSVSIDKIIGTYYADIYGNIDVKKEGDQLRLYFEHSKRFNATLEHWHYDVWKIKWDNVEQRSFFQFATVQFKLDNNLEVVELEFDVPNDDFWFYEFKPKKIRK